jgi:hypothetical protein
MLDIQLRLRGFFYLPRGIASAIIASDIEFPSPMPRYERDISQEEHQLRRHKTLPGPLTFGNQMPEAVPDLTALTPAYTSSITTTQH